VKLAKEAAKEAKEKAEEEENTLPKGAVLVIKNLNGETQREDIKEVLQVRSNHALEILLLDVA